MQVFLVINPNDDLIRRASPFQQNSQSCYRSPTFLIQRHLQIQIYNEKGGILDAEKLYCLESCFSKARFSQKDPKVDSLI